MNTYAYPTGEQECSIIEAPVKEWKSLAKKIEIACLHLKNTSLDKEIDKAASKWSSTERERFRHWYKNTYNTHRATLGSRTSMNREAQYAPHGSAEVKQKFEDKRLSVIKRIRRLQNEIGQLYRSHSKNVEWSDSRYPNGQAKIEAILHALNTVCVLLDTLQTKEITAAVLLRTARHLNSIDATCGQKFREIIGERSDIVRIARQNEVSSVAAELKKELDCFYYGTHLRRLYGIYDQLGKLGLTSLQSDIEQLIQKSLPDVSAIHKQLSEIYTSILEIPQESAPASPATPAPAPKPSPQENASFEAAPSERVNIPAQSPV